MLQIYKIFIPKIRPKLELNIEVSIPGKNILIFQIWLDYWKRQNI